eukprot:1613263-Pleurochrysis_carterae.AAC.1
MTVRNSFSKRQRERNDGCSTDCPRGSTPPDVSCMLFRVPGAGVEHDIASFGSPRACRLRRQAVAKAVQLITEM